MSTDSLSNPIDVFLAESEALDEMEHVQRERLQMEEEYLTRLQSLRRSVKSSRSELSTTQLSQVMIEKMDKDVAAQQDCVREMKDRLDKVPNIEAWNKFRRLVHVMRDEKASHESARHEAEEHINPDEYWKRATHPATWCDLRLPTADILYRIAVNRLNEAKTTALTFYQNHQHELRPFHTKRFRALGELISPGDFHSILVRDDTLTAEHVNTASSPESPTSLSSISEVSISGNIRGSFSPVHYINYLNDATQGFPVFGLSLSSMGGWMTRVILRKNTEAHSPPNLIFTSPEMNTEAMIKAAFKLEGAWNYEELYHLEHALEKLGGGCELQMERGWILGFLLVNLPRPIVGISDTIARSPTRGVHSQEIVHVMPEAKELEILRKIWRHTDAKNIASGACALTHRKGTEKVISDIRRKWNMDTNQPFPSHMRHASEDEGLLHRLTGRRTSTSHGSADHHHHATN